MPLMLTFDYRVTLTKLNMRQLILPTFSCYIIFNCMHYVVYSVFCCFGNIVLGAGSGNLCSAPPKSKKGTAQNGTETEQIV